MSDEQIVSEMPIIDGWRSLILWEGGSRALVRSNDIVRSAKMLLGCVQMAPWKSIEFIGSAS